MANRSPNPEGRSRAISQHAFHTLELVVREGETYTDCLDRNFFLGTTATAMMVAAHHHVRRVRGTPDADRLLEGHLKALAQLLSRETGRTLEIQLSQPSAD